MKLSVKTGRRYRFAIMFLRDDALSKKKTTPRWTSQTCWLYDLRQNKASFRSI